ncbi:ankyrin-3-like [Cataglyphis hispanica]|uniref:ankyrin-3-like n=1 Tax=Cataglyphis hispanica TaxID=1086592 RepID=UPI0021804F42|nr:ankyrin-3-like [Cataglyphis hispanica]
MTSAYEATTEREQQKATTPCDFAKADFNDQELDNPDNSIADMEETLLTSSRRANVVTGNSSFQELTVKDSVLSGELFQDNLNVLDDVRRITENVRKEYKNEKSIDTSRMNKSRNELIFEDNEKHEEDSVLNLSMNNSTATENASTCHAKEDGQDNEVEDQKKFKDQEQRNRSVQEIGVQEQHMTYDSNICVGDKSRDFTARDIRTCYEKVAELRLDTKAETQDEATEREIIIGRQDSDSFYDAVRSGDVKRVSALIASGCVQNLDEPDWNVSGDPPLLMAATNHCLPVLRTLLTNGCDPAVRSPRGETALHRVILNGGPSVLKFVEDLLRHGCPPGVKEAGGGSTALHMLSRQLAHAPLKSHHDFDAALKTLELLAKAGPINAKDHQGRSALHILASSTIFDNNCKTGIESVIETLLTAGADTALKNDRGETALHESLECGTLNTATLLMPRTPTGIVSRYGETPLHIAARKNHIDVVMWLLEHGEDPGAQDAGGNTPLHLASARGFHRTVSLLVTSPLAQLERVNVDGLTALQVAAESGFVNAVRVLLKAGADPSQTMRYCATILRRHPDISVLIDYELTRRRQLAA